MWELLVRAGVSAAVIVAVSEIANRHQRVGALLLTLPLVSVLAFFMALGKRWSWSHWVCRSSSPWPSPSGWDSASGPRCWQVSSWPA